MKRKAFVYIRVSTQEQAEEGYSLGEQESRLQRYCEAMNWECVKVFSDPAYSGSNMERPALKQMIKAIERNEAEIVLVDKLDRLSRSQFDTLYLIKKVFIPHNVAFVSRAESFDTSTPFGRAMIGILAVFAELERERIKERMAEGKIGRAKAGLYQGGYGLTYGYDYSVQTGQLEPNEYEAMVANDIFEMIADRMPLNAIANTLNEKGIKSKWKKRWSQTVIRQMASNQVYVGKIMYKDTVYDGLHEPIISQELFDRVQVIMKERDRKYERCKAGKKYNSPLGGLIWCTHCGAKYAYRKYSANKAYYMCYSRAKCDAKLVKDPNCKNRTYRDSELDEAIYAEILKLKNVEGYYDAIKQSTNHDEKIDILTKQLDAIDKQINKLMDLYAIDGISIESVKEKMLALTEEKAGIENEIEDIRFLKPDISREKINEFVDAFESVVNSGKTSEVHNTLMELIEYIEIDEDDVTIHWNF